MLYRYISSRSQLALRTTSNFPAAHECEGSYPEFGIHTVMTGLASLLVTLLDPLTWSIKGDALRSEI